MHQAKSNSLSRKTCKRCGKKKYLKFMKLTKPLGWKKPKTVCINCKADGRTPTTTT